MSDKEFNSVWTRFITLCRGKLIEKSKQCRLSPAAAEVSVNDAASVWFDRYETCGAWLSKLEKKEPDAAARIKALLQNIHLETVPEKRIISDAEVAGIAAGGAAIGAGVGALGMHLGVIGTLVSAALPAAVLYPAARTYQKEERGKAEKETIQQYIEQISLIKDGIDTILLGIDRD